MVISSEEKRFLAKLKEAGGLGNIIFVKEPFAICRDVNNGDCKYYEPKKGKK